MKNLIMAGIIFGILTAIGAGTYLGITKAAESFAERAEQQQQKVMFKGAVMPGKSKDPYGRYEGRPMDPTKTPHAVMPGVPSHLINDNPTIEQLKQKIELEEKMRNDPYGRYDKDRYSGQPSGERRTRQYDQYGR